MTNEWRAASALVMAVPARYFVVMAESRLLRMRCSTRLSGMKGEEAMTGGGEVEVEAHESQCARGSVQVMGTSVSIKVAELHASEGNEGGKGRRWASGWTFILRERVRSGAVGQGQRGPELPADGLGGLARLTRSSSGLCNATRSMPRWTRSAASGRPHGGVRGAAGG